MRRKERAMATATLDKVGKASRMDIRITTPQRARYEKAAALKGQSLTQWASTHLDACASKDIAEASTTILEDAAFERFCAILDSPCRKPLRTFSRESPSGSERVHQTGAASRWAGPRRIPMR